MEELKGKIASSHAFQSFLKERDVLAAFQAEHWDTKHGIYYKDLDSGKDREIDVLARQIWEKRTKFGDQLVRLTLPIEVKTMRDFHIIVSPENSKTASSYYSNIIWLGDPSEEYSWLRSHLSATGYSEISIKTLLRKTHSFAYPRQSARMSTLMMRPQEELAFGSFRETNLGNEKELDNSVFWRASQSLFSAFKSISESIREYHQDWILGSPRYVKNSEREKFDELYYWLQRHLQMVDIIHPIVVTDARLWSIDGNNPKEVGSCRFGLHKYHGEADWWCDLVNSNHISEFITRVTSHYISHLKRRGLKRE